MEDNFSSTGGGSASTAIVKVTPICGARQEWAPSCYLLEIDSARILLDAGTTSTFDMTHFASLRKLTRSIDLIILSHSDLAHCGGLPYVISSLQLSCPVLATLPVHHMGLVAAYDAYQSHYQATGSAPSSFTLDDLDGAFERITMLRYAQSYTISSGNAMGITVTPIAAGHTLGGAIWRIRKHTEDIFYAASFNHKREGHLDGAALELVQRPSLLIADANGGLDVHLARKQRDTDLVESILSSLKSGGNVLLPVDTAGRSLELIQTIEAHWSAARIAYPVLFLSHQSRRVVELAKGMLEWMSASLAKVFEQDRSNPFELKHIRVVHSVEEIKTIHGPKVILASSESLESGLSRVMLAEMLSSSHSLVLLTIKTETGSLAAKLLGGGRGSKVQFTWAEEVPLEGDELQKYQRAAQEAVERRAAEEAFAQIQKQREDEEDEVDADGAEASAKRLEQEQIASAVALQHVFWTDYKHDWFNNINYSSQHVENSPYYPLLPLDVPVKEDGTPNRYQCFPFREPRRIADDYGEMVDFTNAFSGTTSSFGFKEATVPSTPSATSSNEPKALQLIAPVEVSTTPLTAAKEKIPMKWIQRSVETTVKLNCKFIDFSGVSDGRSLKTIYSRIAPRRMVLVGGSMEATEFLANHFTLATAGTGGAIEEVFAPQVGETITVCSAVNVVPATLSESLIGGLDLQVLGEYEVAWIRGVIDRGVVQTKLDDSMEVDHDDTRSDHEEEAPPVNVSSLLVITAAGLEADHLIKPLLFGDPRLSEIRRLVINELKLPAAFISGDLVCGQADKRVCIRKDPDNPASFTLEGPLCPEYYAIRQILYSTAVFLSA